MTQECLFSIISKDIDAAIMKIDLTKAYDCVDWGFLRILLAKIGLRSQCINLIMACVENVKYVVIINGIPSTFFKAERGLRQGCPLSPLLFILVMDTLSNQIRKVVSEQRCRPVKICKDISLSHNLFVDDVLIFSMLCRMSWRCLHDILFKFQSASVLVINKVKSMLYHNDSDMDTVLWIADLFGILQSSIRGGFKYLGFSLKAKGYGKRDWCWLIDRFFKKISGWESRFLSLAGRLILVQAVLTQLSVYWAHLFHIPASIVKKMCSIAGNFLWGGKSYQSNIKLVKMESISRPKKNGGWGLINMKIFGKALLCKSLYRGIFGSGPWSKIIQNRYLKGRSLEYWFRRSSIGIKKGSAIWISYRKILPFFLENLRWSFFSGSSIYIGIDPIVNGLELMIPRCLISFLQSKGIFTWDRLIKQWTFSTPVWMDGEDLSLPPRMRPIWALVIQNLSSKGIQHSGNKDKLVWSISKSTQPIRVKDIYIAMIDGLPAATASMFPMLLWKVTCLLKITLFSWLVSSNRNLPWEVLQKKGWNGPGRCSMCLSDHETNVHMFFQCGHTLQIWYELPLSFCFPYCVFAFVQEGYRWWSEQRISLRSMFVSVIWLLWKWRNYCIFQDLRIPLASILLRISNFSTAPDV